MKKRFRILLMALLLACCLILSGCGQLKNEVLEGQMSAMVTALNREDYDAFRDLCYPFEDSEMALRTGFEELCANWVPLEPEQLELVQYTESRNAEGTLVQGIFRLPRNDEYNALLIEYWKTEEGSGLVTFRITQVPEGRMKATKLTSNRILQWGWYLLNLGFIIVTIVDIIRKKPSKYGLYIVMALVFFNLRIFVNGFSFTLSIPLGSLIYWIIRRKLV